jgi:O-antigen/teichoic acid export membrane protein
LTILAKMKIGEEAGYVSFEIIGSMIVTYAFWIFLSKVATADEIGTYSIIISLSSIFTNIATVYPLEVVGIISKFKGILIVNSIPPL